MNLRYLPLTDKGAWLTEKWFGVIIYIVLSFIASGRHCTRSRYWGKS
ncbi:UNVERIFIED_ORG: putative membrane protein SirB2 [Pantoea agglomerans]|jgi:uncharacterized membrane protein SirB2